MPGFRELVLRNGAYMALRRGAGVLLAIGGAIIVTRAVGPRAYGLFAGPLVLSGFITSLATFGLDVSLIRRGEDVDEADEHQVASLLLLTGAIALAVGLAVAATLDVWLPDGFGPPLAVLLITLPLALLSLVPAARLERSLRYGTLATIDVGADVLYYTVTLVLALSGAGVWAPVSGWLARHLLRTGTLFAVTRYRPRWYWNGALARSTMRYGFGYSMSGWLQQTQSLANPLIIGRYLGAEAVAVVAIAGRIVDALSFIKQITARLAIAAFGRIHDDLARLRRAHAEAVLLQVLGTGGMLAAFSVVARPALLFAFGERWMDALDLVPWLALAALTGSVFSMHTAVLHVVGRNAAVLQVRFCQALLFATAALLLVPRYGIVGFGLAVAARTLGFAVSDRHLRSLFRPVYRHALPFYAALLPPVFVPVVPWPWAGLLLLPPALILPRRSSRQELRKYASYLWAARPRRRTAVVAG